MCHDTKLSLLGFCCLLLSVVCGCAPRRQVEATPLRNDESEYVLAILLDLSGSFAHLMAEDGKAYDFALIVMDRYFRDRIGTNDKMIIAQVSGTDRALLWEGTPLDLRREFPSADAFRDFLLSKADPGGSLVHEGLARTVEYVTSDPQVASGKAKSAIFVLSDMLDNGPDGRESQERAARALAAYSQKGGVVGLYYVDQSLVAQWRQILRDAKIPDYCVECEIVGKPPLPSFE